MKVYKERQETSLIIIISMLLPNILMKSILFLCALLGIAQSRPQFNPLEAARILRFDNVVDPFGFSYNVDQSDGTRQEAVGVIKNAGTDNESLDVKGSYSYIGPDGVTYEVKYTADEDGFHPEGKHLPPSAGVKKLGIPSSAVASLAGGGLG